MSFFRHGYTAVASEANTRLRSTPSATLPMSIFERPASEQWRMIQTCQKKRVPAIKNGGIVLIRETDAEISRTPK